MKKIQVKPWRLWVVEIITALLLVFFIHSAVDNYSNLLSLQNLLRFYTVNVQLVSWVIVIIEAGIAILLFVPGTRLSGLILSLLFLLTLMIVVVKTPHSPHFFGGVLNYLGRKFYLPFEITMIVLSLTALVFSKRRQPKTTLADTNSILSV